MFEYLWLKVQIASDNVGWVPYRSSYDEDFVFKVTPGAKHGESPLNFFFFSFSSVSFIVNPWCSRSWYIFIFSRWRSFFFCLQVWTAANVSATSFQPCPVLSVWWFWTLQKELSKVKEKLKIYFISIIVIPRRIESLIIFQI